MWRRAVYVVVIASLCLARQPSLAAWEKDTHYGLTLWLGLQADYDLEEAHRKLGKDVAQIVRIAA